jgi:hypothetical protein
MNNELKMNQKEATMTRSTLCLCSCLEELIKNVKNFMMDGVIAEIQVEHLRYTPYKCRAFGLI